MTRRAQTLESLAAVVRRQHLAALGVEARLFEVQVGHQQRLLARPVQRATAAPTGGSADQSQFFVTERKGNHEAALPQRS
jgi:hypothetical protein